MNSIRTHQGKEKTIEREALVLRRMRIHRKISREEAAKAIQRTPKTIEKFENGRMRVGQERIKILLRRYKFTREEFLRFLEIPALLPEAPARSIFRSKAADRTEGRKYQKDITKAARVLKVLRNMRGWSQPFAAAKCGWSRSCIDHLENGRVEATEEKINQVLKAYEVKRHVYEELFEAPQLRDEVITESLSILTKLDNEKLKAVKALLDNFR